jgi:triosephosphate isomerase
MGNWKMHKTVAQARAFAEELGRLSGRLPDSVDYAICAPFTTLHILRVMLPVKVAVGAQNVYFEAKGAFTGEISTEMLREFDTRYVLVGHSERRQIFGESDEWVAKKVKAVADAGMVPVLCVGEDLAQREAGETEAVVHQQVRAGLSQVASDAAADCVIAYEPVWAIGSGKTPTAAEAQTVIHAIRQTLAETCGAKAAEAIRILYGGSVKPDNVASFTEQPDIDGALVGGASLEAESFAAMAEAVGAALAKSSGGGQE